MPPSPWTVLLLVAACAASAPSPPDGVRALLQEATRDWTTEATPHLVLHFPPDSVVEDRAAYAERRERAFDAIVAFFGASPPGPVDVFVWNESDDAVPVLGKPLGFAVPEESVVLSSAGQTPGHEIAHVVCRNAIHAERLSRFLEEGVAVALDGTTRDRLALAREAVQRTGARSISVIALWEREDAWEDLLYPVAGAFVAYLVEKGGRERFLALLADQTPAHAREVYGADFDALVATFEADLVSGEVLPSIDALRTRARERMRKEADTFSREELKALERLYQSGDFRTEEGREALAEVVERYPASNRAGCALLYLARKASGAEREAMLRRAIVSYGDSWYGDGTQVGAYARAILAIDLARAGRTEEAKALAGEVRALFPGAVEHGGARLADVLGAEGL